MSQRPPSSEPPSSATSGPPERRVVERWVVDGLEHSPAGPVARLERPDGSTAVLPLRALPPELQEGDLLEVQDGPDGVVARRLVAETLAARAQAQATLDALNRPTEEGPNNGADEGEITL